MSQPMKVVINGVSGRMGQMLVEAVLKRQNAMLHGVLDAPGHAWVGQDLGVLTGGQAMDVIVSDDPSATLAGADAVIDFTVPKATVALSSYAAEAGVAHVIGTTGMTETDIAAIDGAARTVPIVRAGNMSLGVNLLVQLTKKVAAALDEDFDIEVVEAHHNQKVDAPSGTALMLGEAAAEGRGVAFDDVSDRGRDGITGARKRGDIGFAVVRGGDIVGEHDVVFAAAGERVVLRHLATDRGIFARGALKAADWAVRQSPGHYDMLDVLGLSEEH